MEILENSKEKDWAKCYKAVNFIEKGVCTYQDEVVYLNQETLEKCVRDIKGKPVIIKHQRGINPDNMQEHAVGYVTGADFDEFNASFSCDFVLFDEEAKELISKGWSVSCAYTPKAFGQGGTWHNTAYDREITELEFTHLALVPDPRYEDAKVYENSREEEYEEYENGGPGSGDFDHAGRPGLVGGSEPAGTGRNGKYEGDKKHWVGAKPEQQKNDFDGKKEELKKKNENETDISAIFGEGIKIKELNKKGIFKDSKNLKSYEKEDRKAIVDDFSTDDRERFQVSFETKGAKRILKTYSTKKGMENAIKEYLNPKLKREEILSLNEVEKVYKDNLTSIKDLKQKANKAEFLSPEHIKILQELKKAETSLTKNREAYARSIMDNFEKQDINPYEEKIEAKKDYYKAKSEELRKSSDKNYDLYERTRLPFGQPIVNKQTARAYKANISYFDKSVEDYNKSKYYAEKSSDYGSHGISSDDKNAILKLKEKLDKGVTSAEKRRIIDRVISIHEQNLKAKSSNVTSNENNYSKYGFNVVRNTDINRLQLKFDGKPDDETRSILKSNGFRWSPREGTWQRQLGSNADRGLRYIIEALDKRKEKQNNKEDEMDVNEFISKITDGIVEKFNACKKNEKEEDLEFEEEYDNEDDDELEFEGETYSKKELVNAFKKMKKNEMDEKEKQEKENALGEESFKKLEELLNSRKQDDKMDKIKIESQADRLARGKEIFG